MLLIDDDSDEHSLFQSALYEYNSTVTCMTAFSCEDGYKKAQNRKPDIIFLDMNLPGTNGLSCLRKFKKTRDFKNIPVYLYSAGRDVEKEINIALRKEPFNG